MASNQVLANSTTGKLIVESQVSRMTIAAGFNRFRAALAHWGPSHYIILAVLWFTLSVPLYLAGWGVASVLSLPLLLLMSAALAYCASAVLKPAARPVAQPKPGFPSKLDHPGLGEVPLSAYSNERYERTIDWCGSPIQLSLSVHSMDSIAAVLRAATSISEASATVNSQVVAFAVKELLPGINQERQVQKTPSLTPEQFLQAISLQMITVHPDKTYEFLYSDGDLLGGHWIEVRGEIEHGPMDVDTPG